MKTNNSFLLTAAFAAITFTFFACSGDSPSKPSPSGEPSSNSGFGYCDYGSGGCYPMATAEDEANCAAWGQVVSSCTTSFSSSSNSLPQLSSSSITPPPSSSSSSGGNVLLGYCDYGKFAFQENGELTGGCYPMGTASDQANCTVWGRVVASCPRLSKSSFTLSSAGSSYGDIDMGLTYQASSLTAAIKGKIDLVAYNDAVSNSIKNPCNVPAVGNSTCGSPKLYSVPAKYHAALKTATIASDIKQFLEANDSITKADEIPISLGNTFAVISTDNEFYIVVITSVSTQSVSLEFYSPFL
ncbi:MAG: hypothetical protein LBH25_10640 [Fibromonadaceae bacterium]|jgi:hypothetical protein|nr:hypothetical protein [Fibromonadaceae bacterium]